jgi:hypothetical protein
VTRDTRRPAAHPLVELVHDVRDAIDAAGQDGEATTAARVRVHDAMRGTLRSARRLVDALELLLAEIAVPTDDPADEPPDDQEVDDGDFQRIRVR